MSLTLPPRLQDFPRKVRQHDNGGCIGVCICIFTSLSLSGIVGLHEVKDFKDRVNKMGWSDSIVNIMLEVDDNILDPVQDDLIKNYGTIAVEQVIKSNFSLSMS